MGLLIAFTIHLDHSTTVLQIALHAAVHGIADGSRVIVTEDPSDPSRVNVQCQNQTNAQVLRSKYRNLIAL